MSQALIISLSDLEYLDISSSPPSSPPRFSLESSPPALTSYSIHKRLRTSWVYKHMPDPILNINISVLRAKKSGAVSIALKLILRIEALE